MSAHVSQPDMFTACRFPTADVETELAFCRMLCTNDGTEQVMVVRRPDKSVFTTKSVWVAVAFRMVWVSRELLKQALVANLTHARQAIGVLFHVYTTAGRAALAELRAAPDGHLVALDAMYDGLRALAVWLSPAATLLHLHTALPLLKVHAPTVVWEVQLGIRCAADLRKKAHFQVAAKEYHRLIFIYDWEPDADASAFLCNIGHFGSDAMPPPPPIQVLEPLEDTHLMRRGIAPGADTSGGSPSPSLAELVYPNRPFHTKTNPSCASKLGM